MDEPASEHAAAIETEAPKLSWALVEIFGQGKHYGEIRHVEIAGGKLLEVRDVDTGKAHMYGASAIFSLTPLTQGEIDVHVTGLKRWQETQERWKLERERRAQARLAAPDACPDDDGAFLEP